MRKVNFILAIISIFNISIAVAQKQTPPAGGTAKDFKLPDKKIKTFANGLRTTTVQYGYIPKVNISLIIKTGNVHEGPNEVWLADLTGNMMKQGTATMNFETLSKKVAEMGGEVDISVGPDQTTISGSVLSEFAPQFIAIISDIVMHPALPASELERLKGDLKRQLSVQKASPRNQAMEKFNQAIYKDQPYGRFFPTEEMLNSYTLQMVKDFYNKNFGAKRSVLYVVGKFDEAAVNAAVDKALSKWKAGADVQYPAITLGNTRDTVIVERKNAPQTTVVMGQPVLTPKDKDYLPQGVANSLLGGSFGSRITSNIRESKGYTYSPFSTIAVNRGSSIWREVADITSEHTIDAVREIEKEIKRLQDQPPAAAELEGIKNYMAGTFVLTNSSPSGIIGQLNFLDQYGLPDTYLTNYVKNVYAVTPEKVSEIVKKTLTPEKMLLIMVGDKDVIEKQISSGKKGF